MCAVIKPVTPLDGTGCALCLCRNYNGLHPLREAEHLPQLHRENSSTDGRSGLRPCRYALSRSTEDHSGCCVFIAGPGLVKRCQGVSKGASMVPICLAFPFVDSCLWRCFPCQDFFTDPMDFIPTISQNVPRELYSFLSLFTAQNRPFFR